MIYLYQKIKIYQILFNVYKNVLVHQTEYEDEKEPYQRDDHDDNKLEYPEEFNKFLDGEKKTGSDITEYLKTTFQKKNSKKES
jgi:hypothetical protein